ncbi:hypothetical protein PMIN02_003601 [Paraphaeosphaeria minitans]
MPSFPHSRPPGFPPATPLSFEKSHGLVKECVKLMSELCLLQRRHGPRTGPSTSTSQTAREMTLFHSIPETTLFSFDPAGHTVGHAKGGVKTCKGFAGGQDSSPFWMGVRGL